jgi:hypothetical protein
MMKMEFWFLVIVCFAMEVRKLCRAAKIAQHFANVLHALH